MEIRLGHNASLAKILAVILLAEVAAFLFIGSDIACVLMLAGSLACGTWVVYRGGAFHLLGLIAFVFVARYVWVASLLKLALGQTLESNLFRPEETFLMMLVVSIQLVVAFEVVSRFPLPGPWMPEFHSLNEMRLFSYVTCAVGMGFMVLMAANRRKEPELAGFNFLAENVFPMSIVSRTAYVCLRWKNAKTLDLGLVLMLGMGIGIAFFVGQKIMAFSCLLGYSITLICLRKSIPAGMVVLAGTVMVVLVTVVTPVVNLLRETEKMDFKTPGEKAVILADRFWNHSLTSTVDEFEDRQNTQIHYYDYFGPLGMYRPMAERVALIQNGDALLRGIDAGGYMGWYLVTESYMRLLPRVLNPDKDVISTADHIAWHAGVRRRDSIGFPTIGLIGGCYAVFGWLTVLTLPLILFTLFFASVRVLAGNSCRNVWATYIFVIYSHKFVECDVTPFLQVIMRNLPMDIAVFLPLFVVTKFLSRSHALPVCSTLPRPVANQ